MRKLILSLVVFLAISQFSYAQWTQADPNTVFSYAGNVGIGTSSLSAKFTVHQATQLGTAIKSNTLLTSVGGSTVSNVFKNNLWLVRNAAGGDWQTSRLHDGIGIDVTFLTPQTDTRTWWERDPYGNIQSWGNGASTYLTINQGNIGVGTTTPASGLTVQKEGGNTADGALFLVNGANASFGGFATLAGIKTIAGDGGQYNFLKLQNAGGIKFLIDGSGNVGIGIASPQNKLDVNGTIHSKSVLIDLNGWGDYVFKKNYYLRPLSEVKDYIDKNQHLPEIPSEQEMVKKGLNVSEMNIMLMKKVEELTLYLIEQKEESNKITEYLQKQSQKQQARIDLLIKEVELLNKPLANH